MDELIVSKLIILTISAGRMRGSLLACVFVLFCGANLNAQQMAIHNNILFDLAGDLSMGMEFALKPRTTVEVYGTIRPWKETESSVNKHWAMQAQYRLWTCQKFNGFYWGPYLHAGEYNISNASLPFGLLKGLKSHRYEGWMIGGGIGCGYQYAVSKHWNVGAELGLGYTYFRSKKFDCGVCSTFHGYDNYNYWLFTKGSVYISYIF